MAAYGFAVRENGMYMSRMDWSRIKNWQEQSRAVPPVYSQPGYKDVNKPDHNKELYKTLQY